MEQTYYISSNNTNEKVNFTGLFNYVNKHIITKHKRHMLENYSIIISVDSSSNYLGYYFFNNIICKKINYMCEFVENNSITSKSTINNIDEYSLLVNSSTTYKWYIKYKYILVKPIAPLTPAQTTAYKSCNNKDIICRNGCTCVPNKFNNKEHICVPNEEPYVKGSCEPDNLLLQCSGNDCSNSEYIDDSEDSGRCIYPDGSPPIENKEWCQERCSWHRECTQEHCVNLAPVPGYNCTYIRDNPCKDNPCMNNGTCQASKNSSGKFTGEFKCKCTSCWEGDICNISKPSQLSECNGGPGCVFNNNTCKGTCNNCYKANSSKKCNLCPDTKCKDNELTVCENGTCKCKKGYSSLPNIYSFVGMAGCCNKTCDYAPSWEPPETKENGYVPDYYNILILAFFGEGGPGGAIGRYNDHTEIPQWIQTWKSIPDPWSRKKQVILSVGGQGGAWHEGAVGGVAGHWPKALELLKNNIIDGIDIDVEAAGFPHAKLRDDINNIPRKTKPTITLAPEFWFDYAGPMGMYRPWLDNPDKFSWIHPQMYNNGPSNVGYLELPPPSNAGDGFPGDLDYLFKILKGFQSINKLADNQVGLLTSVNSCGANDDWANGNVSKMLWNITDLAEHIKKNNITNVGNWAFEYDRFMGDKKEAGYKYPWGGLLAYLLLPEIPDFYNGTTRPFNPNLHTKNKLQDLTISAHAAPRGQGIPACGRVCQNKIGDSDKWTTIKNMPYGS